MTAPGSARDPLRRYLSAWIGFSAGGHFSQALAVAIVLFGFSAHVVRTLTGWPGTIAVLASLVVLAALSLAGQRHHIEWHGLLPVSLIALFGYFAVTVFWSQYTWATVGGIAYAAAFAALGLYLALGRDLVQVIRAAGDALRILLVASLALEVLSGLLIDQPIRFLGIEGNLAEGGPIQGLAGTRNFLGFLAALGLVTFATEYLMRSVSLSLGLASGSVAALALVFSRSPVTVVAVVALLASGLALRTLRRAPAARRPLLQTTLAASVVAGTALAWAAHERVLALLGARSDVDVRLALWGRLRDLTDLNPIEGSGFVGLWPTSVFPFSTLLSPTGRPHSTGLGVFWDAWFQVGLVGLLLLLAAGGLALVRSWITASAHPIIAYAWPALVLVLITVTGVAESYVLFEGTLMLFVATATISARKRSWRSKLGSLPRA
ncbi:exopolysaccharide production protein [Frigoribacterium sp. NBH87]|uniref:exopolysaccharide production protein n=1 Tax=Frigoribacterium sp. NBH87 TaxID=2596916 RepID=UPI001629EDF9|nr:exopolysaccharide production protein [Frigoribacterium sp. NBH87]QNE44811.1 exopolysaccharide production protein [Frigoribacterium sp. NBH87]